MHNQIRYLLTIRFINSLYLLIVERAKKLWYQIQQKFFTWAYILLFFLLQVLSERTRQDKKREIQRFNETINCRYISSSNESMRSTTLSAKLIFCTPHIHTHIACIERQTFLPVTSDILLLLLLYSLARKYTSTIEILNILYNDDNNNNSVVCECEDIPYVCCIFMLEHYHHIIIYNNIWYFIYVY